MLLPDCAALVLDSPKSCLPIELWSQPLSFHAEPVWQAPQVPLSWPEFARQLTIAVLRWRRTLPMLGEELGLGSARVTNR